MVLGRKETKSYMNNSSREFYDGIMKGGHRKMLMFNEFTNCCLEIVFSIDVVHLQLL